jgi:hypothetical protein
LHSVNASRNAIGLPTIFQLGNNPALDFVPWNCFRLAGIKFIDAAAISWSQANRLLSSLVTLEF